MKRFLSIAVALLMVLALLPTSVLAAGGGEETLVVDNVKPLTVEPEKKADEEKGVSYFQLYNFEYSAESEFTQEWTLTDSDGDGRNWGWYGYNINYDSTFGPNFAANGVGCMASFSFDYYTNGPITPDNWAVSPGVLIPNRNPYVTWYVTAWDSNFPAEHYAVYIGTSPNVGSMTKVFEETLTVNESQYQLRTVDLAAYVGQTIYIAFRHYNCSYQSFMAIDVVQFLADTPASVNTAANPEHGNLIFETGGDYPWFVESEGSRQYVRSSNAGQDSTSSSITSNVIANVGDTLSFDFKAWGESFGSSYYDVCEFRVDGWTAARWGELDNDWETYVYTFETEGPHELEWVYTKDYSVSSTGDYFAIDEVYLTRVPSEDLIKACYFEEELDGTYAWYNDWNLMDYDGDGREFLWVHGEGFANIAYEGYGLFVSLSGDGQGAHYNPNDYAIYGPVQLRNYNNSLSFRLAGLNDSQVEHCRVLVGTSLSGTYTVVANLSTQGSYTKTTVSLDSYAGQSVYILFQHYNSSSASGMLRLDMVEVRGSNSLPTPTEPPQPTAEPTDPPATALDSALNVEGGTIRFVNDATYPWYVEEEGDRVFARSGNSGVGGSTSTITAAVTVIGNNSMISFDYKALGEGSDDYDWDKCRFYIDGELMMDYGEHDNIWGSIAFNISQGEHTLTWTYKKDGSVDPDGDYFAVDEVELLESLIPPPPPPVQLIDTIEINGYVEPVWGEGATYNLSVPDGAHYQLEYYDWKWYDGGTNHMLNEGDPFNQDTGFYYMLIRLDYDSDCVISSDVVVKLNGEAIEPPWQNDYQDDDSFCFHTPNVVLMNPLDAALNAEGGTIRFTNDETYPWLVMDGGDRIYAMSGNGGWSNSTSSISAVVNVGEDYAVCFDYQAWGEGYDTNDWDKCRFYVDGEIMMDYGDHQNDWESFLCPLTPGEHTLTWTYKKDGSVNPTGDYFAVDNVQLIHSETPPPPVFSITNIDITGFTAPEWGAVPDCDISIPENVEYSIQSFWWMKNSSGMAEGDVFDDPNAEYFMQIVIAPAENASFDENVVVTINGDTSLVSQATYNPDTDRLVIQTVRFTVEEPFTGVMGDIEMDGDVDVMDALMLLRYSMGLITLTDEQVALGDVNGSGASDTMDALLIMRRALGLISQFPNA